MKDNNNVSVVRYQASKVSKEQKPAIKLHQLGTRIPKSTLEKFRSFVLAKHGKINGPFSVEVTLALESWMDKQHLTTTYALTHGKGRPRADVIEKYKAIAMEFKKLNSFPYINVATIKATMSRVLGVCDRRTMVKYQKTIQRLSKEESARFGMMPTFDVSRFVEKITGGDW